MALVYIPPRQLTKQTVIHIITSTHHFTLDVLINSRKYMITVSIKEVTPTISLTLSNREEEKQKRRLDTTWLLQLLLQQFY